MFQHRNVLNLPYSATPGRSLVVKHRTRECTDHTRILFGALLHLVHGSGARTKRFGNARVLREVVEPFCRHGFNVILLNSRGVGGSTGRASFTGLPEAEDLNEVVKWLMENQFPALEELVLLVRSLDLCRSGSIYSASFIGILTWMHTNIAHQTLTSASQDPICPPFLSVDRTPFYHPLQS